MPAAAPPALCIAIVGAESTGKTTLARALAQALASPVALASSASPTAPVAAAGAQAPGLRVAWVPEWLRQWCEAQGRTPRADEQAAIATEQHARIRAAAATHDVVVSDTTALMTAVYSRLIFGDRSLELPAVALHREMHLTLLTALDLPWRPDGLQRDGPHVREPVDDALRDLLHAHDLGYAVVAGRGRHRQDQALAAVRSLLPAVAETGAPPSRLAPSPLFTRLLGPTGGPPGAAPLHASAWVCECCLPQAERALRHRA